MERIPYTRGLTNTAVMLNKIRTEMFIEANGDRPDVQNQAIIITDGKATISPEMVIPEGIFAKGAGIHIMVVPIGKVKMINEKTWTSSALCFYSSSIFDFML